MIPLALFIVGVTLLALYGLTVSGHFPAEARRKELQTSTATAAIAATLFTSGVATILVMTVAVNSLPWTAIIIGGGAALLAGPLLLRTFPDEFVDGLAGLLTFAAAAIFTGLLLWLTH
jgi:uncharacterized integral membrane protein